MKFSRAIRAFCYYMNNLRKTLDPYYFKTLIEYIEKSKNSSFKYSFKRSFPVLYEWKKEAGTVDPHYFLQDIYMTKEINKNAPKVHYDIGSRVSGFISNLLSSDIVQKIILVDVRPLSVKIDGLEFIEDDATMLEKIDDNSVSSISSLHAIEHFGLGRYGDRVDPDGWKKGLIAIERKVQVGGVFLSVNSNCKRRYFSF